MIYHDYIRSLDPMQWEFFAADVLNHLEYSIILQPAEGQDRGCDLLVERDGVRYVVSCKHNLNAGTPVGPNAEPDLRDLIDDFDAHGFIAFYSTHATSKLQARFAKAAKQGYQIIQLYLTNILEIIPTMPGVVLQKYFKHPQDLHHHIENYATCFPLVCMHPKCTRNTLLPNNINSSRAGFAIDAQDKLHILYGCVECIDPFLAPGYFAEFSQIRYPEQMHNFLGIINELPDFYRNYYSLLGGKKRKFEYSDDFFQCLNQLNRGILQIQIPSSWGTWLR